MFKSLACAVVLTAAAPVLAESVEVRTDDIDLSTQAGTKQLDQRILQAARKICASKATGTRLASKSSAQCIRTTVGETRARVAANTVRASS